jgi:hypothetical protein
MGVGLVIADNPAEPDLVADPLDCWQEITKFKVLIPCKLVLSRLPQFSLLKLDPSGLEFFLDVHFA